MTIDTVGISADDVSIGDGGHSLTFENLGGVAGVFEISLDVVHTAEPGMLALFGLGLFGLGIARHRNAAYSLLRTVTDYRG